MFTTTNERFPFNDNCRCQFSIKNLNTILKTLTISHCDFARFSVNDIHACVCDIIKSAKFKAPTNLFIVSF